MKRECVKMEIINFDLTVGVKDFDTSKMNEWTDEEWEEFIGDPTEEIKPLYLLLVDDMDLRLEIVNLYFNDFDKYIIVVLDAHNKTEKDIIIQFSRWRLDDQYFDLNSAFMYSVEKKMDMKNMKITANYMFFKTMTLHVNVLDAKTNARLREFEFNILS